MQGKPTVLVVEDDDAIRTGLCDVLVFHGLAPTGEADGARGLALALAGSYPLVLLDVMLPTMDGFTICTRIREAHKDSAILMLTAKGAEEDILRGFSCGADDYVTKPFSLSQLVARVSALLRRVRPPQRFRCGNVEIDVDRLVARVGDRVGPLTGRDVELLDYLRRAQRRIVGREELLREIWGYQRTDGVETRCVDMHVAKLRKKLLDVTREEVIETVRGAGYRLI